MDLKSRKRWTLVILLIGLPLYIIAAVVVTNVIYDRWGQMPFLLELAVYVGLGIVWILPFRRVFRGTGRGEE